MLSQRGVGALRARGESRKSVAGGALARAALCVATLLLAGPCGLCSSGGTEFLELPTVKAPRMSCKTRYREWSDVVVAAVEPDVRALAQALARPDAVEVLMSLATESNAAGSKGAALRGPNHFTVFHTRALSHMGAMNRLVQMASGEVVLLVLPGQEAHVSPAAVAEAAAQFAQRPALGLLGFSHGYTDDGQVAVSTGAFWYVAAAAFGPLAVRRRALLELGGLAEAECHGGGRGCQANAALELSARMWRAGYSVGLHSLGDTPLAAPCGDVQAYAAQLKAAWDQSLSKGHEEAVPNTKLESTARTPIRVGSKGRPPANGPCTPPASPTIEASLVIQYFRRKSNVKSIVKGIRATVKNAEVLINDDSQTDYDEWVGSLSQAGLTGGGYLVYSPNIHEIRGYNRLAKLASGSILVFMQDDDAPKATGWLKTAQMLFKSHPSMQLLGGLRGRMDYGTMMDPKYNYINGPKYGPPSEARSCCSKIPTVDPTTGVEFMFVYKVNMGPMMVPRDTFLATGMYHTSLSCPGDPGIGFDFEYSIRMWHTGRAVGLYNSGFALDIGNHDNSGTRSSSRIYGVRRKNELRNNKLMYSMYKGFHHGKGNKRAADMWDKLKKGKNYKKPTDASATASFIADVLRYRGRSDGGGAEGALAAARKQGVTGLVRKAAGSNWHPRRQRSAPPPAAPRAGGAPARRVISRTRLPGRPKP